MQGREDKDGMCKEKSSSLAVEFLEILADSLHFPLPPVSLFLSLSAFFFIFFLSFLFQSFSLSLSITDITNKIK